MAHIFHSWCLEAYVHECSESKNLLCPLCELSKKEIIDTNLKTPNQSKNQTKNQPKSQPKSQPKNQPKSKDLQLPPKKRFNRYISFVPKLRS